MTCLPEARRAREAEMSYAVLAMATDYDCWHESHEHVAVDAVVAVLKVNSFTFCLACPCAKTPPPLPQPGQLVCSPFLPPYDTPQKNVATSQNIVRNVVKKLEKHVGPNPQHDALKVAVMTSPKVMNKQTMRELAPLIKKCVREWPIAGEPGREEGRGKVGGAR